MPGSTRQNRPWEVGDYYHGPPSRIRLPYLLLLEARQASRCPKVPPRSHTRSKDGSLAHRYLSPVHILFRSTDHFLSSGNYHQLFRDAFRYNLALVEEYGGAVKINALLGVIPQISAKSEVAHASSAEPTSLHIRPSRSASHTRQRTAHLYRNRHVHHVRFTLPTPTCQTLQPVPQGQPFDIWPRSDLDSRYVVSPVLHETSHMIHLINKVNSTRSNARCLIPYSHWPTCVICSQSYSLLQTGSV